MVVCHCEVVNDQTIVAAIQAGAVDADDLATLCGAGERCGGCRPTIESLLVQIRLAEQPAA
jgi:bacterioferritin-associated ferredoxin